MSGVGNYRKSCRTFPLGNTKNFLFFKSLKTSLVGFYFFFRRYIVKIVVKESPLQEQPNEKMLFTFFS